MAKILMVDDDIDFIEINKIVLENAGYEIDSCSESGDVLSKIEEYQPNLIILDLMMEHYDSGFKLAHSIKGDERYKNIPIILATAVASETGKRFSAKTEEEKAWIKVDAFLDKPISPDDLIGAVKNLLQGN